MTPISRTLSPCKSETLHPRNSRSLCPVFPNPPPPPRLTTIRVSVATDLTTPGTSQSRMTQYSSLCDGLMSLCVTSSGFIHVGERVRISPPSRLHTPLDAWPTSPSIPLPAHAGRSHPPAPVNNAAVHTGVRLPLHPACTSSGYTLRRKKTAGGPSRPCSTAAAPVYRPPNSTRGLPVLHTLANTCHCGFDRSPPLMGM